MFELHYFGEIICLEFKDNNEPLSAVCEDYYEWVPQLPFEVTIMQQAMQQRATQLSQQEMPKYVSDHQHGIINFANQYRRIMGDEFLEMDQVTEEPTRLNFCKIQYRALEEMLLFIQNYFQRYFDMEAFIPEAHREMAVQEIAPRLPLLREQLLDAQFSEKLLDIAFEPLIEFAEEQRKVTYQRLFYLQDLVKDLGLIAAGKKKGKQFIRLEDELFDSLCQLNFNSPAFKNYIKERCREIVEAKDTREAKLITLIELEEMCRDFEVKVPVSLFPEEEGLRTNIKNHLERKKASITEIAVLSKDYAARQPRSGQPYKLPLNLTGSQLGFFLRILVSLGIISEPVKLRIFEFFATHFLVENFKDITSETLDSRFHNPSLGTKDFIRSLIKRMGKAVEEG